jgi:hypothetical protein
MIVTKAQEAIASITPEEIDKYNKYWLKITPNDDEEYYWRWIFGFLSVHTSWSSNVNSYSLLRRHEWRDNEQELMRLLKESRVGLYKVRHRGILEFTTAYWKNPECWKKYKTESWISCRNRLMNKCYGLGLAKTAFSLEMCYPLENRSVCLDTHMYQLYGYSTKELHKAQKHYSLMESYWNIYCDDKGVSPYIARCIFWDKKQNQTDSRYWSYVLENESTKICN